jgi:hypothetical protein
MLLEYAVFLFGNTHKNLQVHDRVAVRKLPSFLSTALELMSLKYRNQTNAPQMRI